MTSTEYNPHMITTTFLKQAQEKIDALMVKAAAHEHKANLDHIADIHSQIDKLKEHLGKIHEVLLPTQMAMSQLGGTFKAKSYWDGNWKNPLLDSERGIHNVNT